MNIYDLAREAFKDQQSQDTEGGVPCSVSFIIGFVQGYQRGDKAGSLTSSELKDEFKLKSEIEKLKAQVEDLEAANNILKQSIKYLNKNPRTLF